MVCNLKKLILFLCVLFLNYSCVKQEEIDPIESALSEDDVSENLLILSYSPSGNLAANISSTAITLTTNSAANCRYSQTNSNWSLMSPFSQTGATFHQENLNGLSLGSNFRYFVTCSIDNGESVTSSTINFNTIQSQTEEEAEASNATSFNDPLIPFSWHINNTGQANFSAAGGTAGEDINVIEILEDAITGKNIKIAVSDDGLEITHEDLAANIIPNASRSYVSSSPATWISDPVHEADSIGHGTAVSGIIAAVAGNGLGGIGIAPDAQLAGFRYLSTTQSLAKDIDQANGDFDIFNYSYGYTNCAKIDIEDSLIAQYEYGTSTLRSGKGAIYIKAAGNDFVGTLRDCGVASDNLFFGNANMAEDNTLPEIIVVAAINADGTAASYSTPGANLWISGTGGEFGIDKPALISTDRTGCNVGFSTDAASPANSFEDGGTLNTNCNYTSTMNGTSAATPSTSGVVALMLEANPNLTWRDVKYILAISARQVQSSAGTSNHPTGENLSGHVYQDGWVINGAGIPFHNWYGFGAVDAMAAVTMATTYNTYLPALVKTSWEDSGTLSLGVPDNNATGVSNSITISENVQIEAVQLEASVSHTFAGDLGLEITSPAGTKSILLNINSNILDTNLSNAIFTSNAFLNESSQGQWTVKVIDGAAQDTGTLTNWKLRFYGH